jgi:hypothetical protein
LVSDDVLRKLANIRVKQPQPLDVRPDDYDVRDGMVRCTRGQVVTHVIISNEKPYEFPGTKPDESGYTQPYDYGAVTGLRRRELDDDGAFEKTVAAVPFRDWWVEVQVRDVPEGSKLDAILKQEVAEILDRLEVLVSR